MHHYFSQLKILWSNEGKGLWFSPAEIYSYSDFPSVSKDYMLPKWLKCRPLLRINESMYPIQSCHQEGVSENLYFTGPTAHAQCIISYRRLPHFRNHFVGFHLLFSNDSLLFHPFFNMKNPYVWFVKCENQLWVVSAARNKIPCFLCFPGQITLKANLTCN